MELKWQMVQNQESGNYICKKYCESYGYAYLHAFIGSQWNSVFSYHK